jgi:PAS domain S-box-containing protein
VVSLLSNSLLKDLPSLAAIIDRQPLTVHPNLPLVEVISIMSQSRGSNCRLSNSDQSSELGQLLPATHSSVLVIEDDLLVGIFTERDLVRLTSTNTDLRGLTIAAVMTKQPRTLVLSPEQTVISALSILQEHRIRHLPVVDSQNQLVGLIMPDQIRQILQLTDLLKFRSVAEDMTTNVVHVTAEATIFQIAQLMVEHQISSIVIVDGEQPPRPIGIVTEKDIVQFQVLELDLNQLSVAAVMSTPLFFLQPIESLWLAQQMMESKHIRHLVVTGEQGQLVGIVTQSNLLKSLDPLEMTRVVDSFQAQLIDQAAELEQTNEGLRSEIVRRQQVEEQLLQASQLLKKQVVAGTDELALRTQQLQSKTADQQSCDIALEVSQQGISDFIENAPIGMNWVDREGITVWANRAELEMLGYDREEYIGKPLMDFHIDKKAIEDIFQCLLRNEPIRDREAKMRHKDGSILDVSLDSNALFRDGIFIHARYFIRNITEKKLLEKKFLRVQRLESLGTLASGIAHDLNNVLTPILGAAQLLSHTLPIVDERNHRLLTMLVDSSRRGSNLVKQILTFARGLDGQATTLQVGYILSEIVSVARQTFPKSIKVELDRPAEDIGMICADATQIHQVIMNLFVNARDAMPTGGVLTAIAQNVLLDAASAKRHVNCNPGHYVMIMVADTGLGIDSEQIDRIFDPFFTTKETGTGLGLSTVSGIIKAHGGFIEVTSEVRTAPTSSQPHGTCFQIFLPMVTSSAIEQTVAKPELFDGQGQLVLVVDDEAAVREIAKDSLEAYNYRVMLASDGVEAIALYVQNQDKIAAVVLDMMMPNIDTPAVIQVLQRINPTVKIIAMSGSVANEQIVQQYGLAAFLTKPFTGTELLKELANF